MIPIAPLQSGSSRAGSVAAEPACGCLVTVLDDFAPPAWDVFVYRPQRGPVPPRIRRVFDAIVEALSDPALARQHEDLINFQ
jgi:DNA-binding transcriptional LysR family regulator